MIWDYWYELWYWLWYFRDYIEIMKFGYRRLYCLGKKIDFIGFKMNFGLIGGELIWNDAEK